MIFFVIIIFGILFYFILLNEGRIGRKKLTDPEKARTNATIEKIEPERYGSKGSSHFEVTVYFSDGTTYRDKCNSDTAHFLYKTFQVDQEKLPTVIQEAIDAHTQAAEKYKQYYEDDEE